MKKTKITELPREVNKARVHRGDLKVKMRHGANSTLAIAENRKQLCYYNRFIYSYHLFISLSSISLINVYTDVHKHP